MHCFHMPYGHMLSCYLGIGIGGKQACKTWQENISYRKCCSKKNNIMSDVTMSKNLRKWTIFCWTTGSFGYLFFVETQVHSTRCSLNPMLIQPVHSVVVFDISKSLAYLFFLWLLWHVLILFVPFFVPWNHMILTYCDSRSWIYLDVFHKNENLKKEKHKAWFVWPIDPACAPPSPIKRVPGSNFRTHPAPDLSEREKRAPLRVPRKTLKETWG